MIHPSTAVRHIDNDIGNGVFATEDIPCGTIVYVKDELELVFDALDSRHDDPRYGHHIEKYSYKEANGCKVLSWDHAKYVNHSCNANTLSTGYGFEIAVRDIRAGEQITDDYGMLNIEHAMACLCGSHLCRKEIGIDDFNNNYLAWDHLVQGALARFMAVEQPLLDYLDEDTRTMLREYLQTGERYISVRNLEYRMMPGQLASFSL